MPNQRGVLDLRILTLFFGLILLVAGVAFIASGNATGNIVGQSVGAVCGVPLFLLGLILALVGLFGGRQQQQMQQQQQQSVVIVPQYAPPPPAPQYYPPTAYQATPSSVPPNQSQTQGQTLPPAESSRKFCPVCGNHYPSEYNVCPRDSSPLKSLQ